MKERERERERESLRFDNGGNKLVAISLIWIPKLTHPVEELIEREREIRREERGSEMG